MDDLQSLGRRRMLATSGGIALAGLSGLAPVAIAQGKDGEAAKAAAPAAPAAKAAAPAAKPLPEYAKWKDADSLIVHSNNTIELKRCAMGSGGVTPLDRLFVRNNVSPPSADIVKDPDSWKIDVEGVGKPRSFTVAELKTMGLVSVPIVLQCSGNGRAWFPSKPSGTQWQVGAAGCVIFSGVPVQAILDATGGMADGMVFMTSTGGEEIPAGIDAKTVMVERSVPIAALKEAFLAWEVNGEPIPLAHGGPLRMIVPGYTGVNNVKYVKRLAFTKEQSPATIQQTGYRFAPVGEKGAPVHASIWEMPVKSWVTHPCGDDEKLKAGKVQIRGLAMGGMSAAKKVEVSVNGGKDWKEATFIGPDLGPYAWREFVLSTTLDAGTHEVTSRATNEKGDTQPENRLENNRGYLNNSWRDHMVKVTVA